jgi:hypothetical protein
MQARRSTLQPNPGRFPFTRPLLMVSTIRNTRPTCLASGRLEISIPGSWILLRMFLKKEWQPSKAV